MQEFFQILGVFAFASALAFALSALWANRARQWRSDALKEGDLVRLRTAAGMYRSRFGGSRQGRLAFDAPLQRGNYVPISAGERVTVEAHSATGVCIFRTTVLDRDSKTHELFLAQPEKVHFEERRQGKRVKPAGTPIRVEDNAAWLQDLSEDGICYTSDESPHRGERIRVDLEGATTFAWVLSSEENEGAGRGRHRIRARFEEPYMI